MSLSNRNRRDDAQKAISLIMNELGDRGVNEVLFGIDRPPFDSILASTWQDLGDQLLIQRDDTQEDSLCKLTSHGWITGLEFGGTINSPDFKRQVGRVMAALKAEIDGRHQRAIVESTDIAAKAGVSDGFVFNFIESHFADLVLHRTGAFWNTRGYSIEIPVNFGLPHVGC